jgi:hypothetical protein
VSIPTEAQRTAQRRIARQIAELGFVLPGSVVRRSTTCGNPGCHCAADPPALHGPYLTWTRKVAGRTVSRRLTADQLADYGPWFANARRLRALVAELEGLSIGVLATDPRSSAGRRGGAAPEPGPARLRKTPAT